MEGERDSSSPSDQKTCTITTATPSSSPSLDFDVDFTSVYNSIFPPRSSLSPFVITDDHHLLATEHRLHQERLILEYEQLCNHYDLCFARLKAIMRELEILRQENADLGLANAGLLKLLTSSFHRLSDDISAGFSPTSIIEPSRFEKVNILERDSIPKSISVRSAGYNKAKQTNASSGSSRQRVLKVNTPVGNKRGQEAKPVELEVYNQGMWKTELCNKWEETGTCPYGDYCQFAHGITELRPVIRHPKYKTEVCQMVLTGATCYYGHRCHFRHSLTDHERMLLPR